MDLTDGRIPGFTDARDVDDVIIYYQVAPGDGVGGRVGSAGPVKLRENDGTPISGIMRFDSFDVANDITIFPNIILHEMAHVLGIGSSFWTAFGCYSATCTPGSGADITYTCPRALAQLPLLDCTAPGVTLAIETALGNGSGCSHWRQETFDTELMTPVRFSHALSNKAHYSSFPQTDASFEEENGIFVLLMIIYAFSRTTHRFFLMGPICPFPASQWVPWRTSGEWVA